MSIINTILIIVNIRTTIIFTLTQKNPKDEQVEGCMKADKSVDTTGMEIVYTLINFIKTSIRETNSNIRTQLYLCLIQTS